MPCPASSWIQHAASIAVLTGAGISVESGIPTWRGSEGLWQQYRPEELASEEGFYRDPQLVWGWYDWRRGIAAQAEPNAGHRALCMLEERTPWFTLITQNVDGLQERAGSQNLLRLHGSLWVLRCTRCQRETEDRRVPLPELPPKCLHCGGLLRPGVVWFGEELPDGIWDKAQRAATSAEVLLVVGTSAAVYPAALLIPLAKRAGAKTIEVNIEETRYSAQVDCFLRGPAGEVLPSLLA